jgi:hypothetical protein
MQRISVALNAFYNALAAPDRDGEQRADVHHQRFARTLSSNGGGTRPRVGRHPVVMGNTDTLGGPLLGGRSLRQLSQRRADGTNSLDRGQMIPDSRSSR